MALIDKIKSETESLRRIAETNELVGYLAWLNLLAFSAFGLAFLVLAKSFVLGLGCLVLAVVNYAVVGKGKTL